MSEDTTKTIHDTIVDDINRGLREWESGKQASPDQRDYVISGCKALGIEWRTIETDVDRIANELYEDAGMNITTVDDLAAYVLLSLTMIRFAEGTSVTLKHDVDRYPHFIAPAGTTGTVTYADSDAIMVTMDAEIAGAEVWSNEIHWYPQDGHEIARDVDVVISWEAEQT